jgi:superfamily I DNA/RNA helicase
LKGMGAIRCPARERTSLAAWHGLLPTETVAITFTRKAAAELKGRIRRLIASLRATPPIQGDDKGVHDPRISDQGDVEMLLSLMDDAPISTIDSFLSSIVSPWMGLVSENPATEQIDDEGSILLREEAIRTAWRLQKGIDGVEVGMRGNIERFLQSRDRLSVRLGGQTASSTVIRGLLKRSLFVEEAARSLGRKSRQIKAEDLDSLFLSPTVEILDNWYSDFRILIEEWVNAWLDGGGHFVFGADVEEGMTRFRYVQYLCTLDSEDKIWRLQWIWLVSHAITSPSNLNKIECKPLYRASPPQAERWPSGILSKTANKIMDSDVKNLITQTTENISISIREIMCTSNALLLRSIGRASFLLNPIIDEPEEVPGQYAYPPRLEPDIGELPPGRAMRLTTELEIEVMQDLFTVHSGIQDILSHLKSLEGVTDYDDMHRYAEDLLLARCPAVCRSWYPVKVIDALDSMEEPWLDNHLSKAIIACGDKSDVHEDLMRRISILRELRRGYRAFIIDEYQDTNPQHFRLLARLWGRRHLEPEEQREPAGEWDPTVCIVGDMKQSIYRFRQAEVTVMRRAVETIRRINTDEGELEHRLQDIRRKNQARDPRPIPGKGGAGTGFIRSTELLSQDAKREEWISFDMDDTKAVLEPSIIQKRREGHIEMRTNHRTLPRLLSTMNYIFQDTFSRRHHKLPGPWHAEAQDLNPARESNLEPSLEWILPTRTDSTDPPSDPNIAIDPFQHGDSSDRDLANQLIGKRLVSLLNNEKVRVKDVANNGWKEIDENIEKIRPDDIMILVSSRSRIPEILRVLEEHGIPAVADKQGVLLNRPVVQPLMSLLWLACSPNDRSAAFAVGHSCIVGLDDSKLNDYLAKSTGNQILALAEIAPNNEVKSLLERINYFVLNNEIHSALTVAIDHSDLLITYPREGDRQDVNNWLSLFERILEKEGDDAALAQLRLRELVALDGDGPKSTSDGTGGAVQVLTIHSSKGLESPVVLLYDMFNVGVRDSSLSSMDNVLVTPQMIAGRIHPWRGFSKPESGLWTLANIMDEGQRLAERRRQFYVALTRARDRLILVGGPRSNTTESSDGFIEMHRGKSRPNMGYMFLDGLAHASIEAGNSGCIWSNQGLDQTGQDLKLDPGALIGTSNLPESCVKGIAIFHNPSCFTSVELKSPLQRWNERLANLTESNSEKEEPKTKQIMHEIGLPSHSLDSAWRCKRHHWLTMRLNWRAEPINYITMEKEEPFWPSATEFGSLFHRLLEIGLPNPAKGSLGLDNTWIENQPNRLLDSDTFDEVLAQSSFTDIQMTKRVRTRMHHLAKLVDEGILGELTNGGIFDGMYVEGLRTELPFNYVHNSEQQIQRKAWSPRGITNLLCIDSVRATFDGRADLVLALRDEQNKGWLQVVDAKTKGCLSGYNSKSPSEGHPLQIVTDDKSPYATSDAEKQILAEHRLQLTLYCIALEENESKKPENQRRQILPPAILVAASGRMIRMHEEEYSKSKSDLSELISWMSYISAIDEETDPPSCTDPETCKVCSLLSGDIKLNGK